jgi:hypothetical protein
MLNSKVYYNYLKNHYNNINISINEILKKLNLLGLFNLTVIIFFNLLKIFIYLILSIFKFNINKKFSNIAEIKFILNI